MSVRCERCGEPAIPVEATRVFCERCASIASTGARDSSELLFTISAPARAERSSVDDLRSLASPPPEIRDEPIHDEPIHFTPLAAPPRLELIDAPRSRSARTIAIAVVAAILVIGSGAFAWRATRPQRPPVVHATTSIGNAAAQRVRGAHVIAAGEHAPVIASTETAAQRASEPPFAAPAMPVAELPPRESSVVPEAIELRPPASRNLVPPTVRARASSSSHIEPSRVSTQPARQELARLPGRADVRDAMNGVASAVARCAEGTHGLVTTRVTFLGATGRAVHAEVVDGIVPPGVRSCIALALRRAELRPFAQDRFTVAYPYRL